VTAEAPGKAGPAPNPRHKPELDEMGIALYHERVPYRAGGKGAKSEGPRKPTLDETGRGRSQNPTAARARPPGAPACAAAGSRGAMRKV
jgi:hypothetical protein